MKLIRPIEFAAERFHVSIACIWSLAMKKKIKKYWVGQTCVNVSEVDKYMLKHSEYLKQWQEKRELSNKDRTKHKMT